MLHAAASVRRQNPWQYLPLGIDTNEAESKFSGDAKSCDASASIGGRILSHPGRKNHGVGRLYSPFLVVAFNNPGGNATGVVNLAGEVTGKRLQLLSLT